VSRRRDLFSTPRRAARLQAPHYDSEAFGNFSETIARYLGTARYLVFQSVVVIGWIGWNVIFSNSEAGFDPYPFILLTLALSLQASYAAPLILLAQNRQEMRDKVVAEQDRQANARAHADMEFLAREVASLRMSVGEVATRDFLRSELRGLMSDIEELTRPEPEPPGDPGGS
jgi:uncharacterized membrane protein